MNKKTKSNAKEKENNNTSGQLEPGDVVVYFRNGKPFHFGTKMKQEPKDCAPEIAHAANGQLYRSHLKRKPEKQHSHEVWRLEDG